MYKLLIALIVLPVLSAEATPVLYRANGEIHCVTIGEVQAGNVRLFVRDGEVVGKFRNTKGGTYQGDLFGQLTIEKRHHAGGYSEPYDYYQLTAQVEFNSGEAKLPANRSVRFLSRRANLSIVDRGLYEKSLVLGQSEMIGGPFFYQTLECKFDLEP